MKNNKTKVVVLSLAILFGGIVALTANAFGPPHHGGGLPGLRALMDLDLSDSQRAEVKAILGQNREKGKEFRNKLLGLKEKSMDVIEAEPFDEENVRQIFQQMAPILEDAMVFKANLMVELRAVLTPEQQEILKQKKTEMCSRMKKDMQFMESMMDSWIQTDTE